MKSWMTGLALLAALALAPVAAPADEAGSSSLEELVVKMADTPEDHAALAEHFRAKAADARRAAKSHEGMARTYGGGRISTRVQMEGHCKRLAAADNSEADEYEALANLHEAESKK